MRSYDFCEFAGDNVSRCGELSTSLVELLKTQAKNKWNTGREARRSADCSLGGASRCRGPSMVPLSSFATHFRVGLRVGLGNEQRLFIDWFGSSAGNSFLLAGEAKVVVVFVEVRLLRPLKTVAAKPNAKVS